jgi:hypothetical protein
LALTGRLGSPRTDFGFNKSNGRGAERVSLYTSTLRMPELRSPGSSVRGASTAMWVLRGCATVQTDEGGLRSLDLFQTTSFHHAPAPGHLVKIVSESGLLLRRTCTVSSYFESSVRRK